MEKKICDVCGKAFEPRTSRQKRCSPACAAQAGRAYSRAYYAENRGRILKYHHDRQAGLTEWNRLYYKTHREAILDGAKRRRTRALPDERVCDVCGKPFRPVTYNQKRCSKKCRLEAEYRRRREADNG